MKILTLGPKCRRSAFQMLHWAICTCGQCLHYFVVLSHIHRGRRVGYVGLWYEHGVGEGERCVRDVLQRRDKLENRGD